MTKYCNYSLATVLIATTILLSTSCSKKDVIKENHLTWNHFVHSLTDTESLPILNDANIQFLSSHDRTGGNNDFNYFERKSKDTGWIVLADLKGPGCIRRWWMTGTDPGHRVQVYIDGEKSARIDSAIDLLFGNNSPWVPPLAQYVNMCYYSYVPVSFNQSIRIETMEPNNHPFWGPRRIFFQLGVEYFDGNTTSVESYPKVLSQAQLDTISSVNREWTDIIESHDVSLDNSNVTKIQAGQRGDVFKKEGAGTAKEWAIKVEPTATADVSQRDREYLLQDTVLRVFYGSGISASVEVPLGDFFANAWRKRSYGSAWMTSGENGYSCRLPMPFREGIRVEIENASDHPIDVSFSAIVDDQVLDNAGYLHAEYRRTGPDGSQPHPITTINGRGKFLGAFLGVTGLDTSWWILEGDERMWVDGNTQPVWQGTGLEDYFNGGWYYRGSVLGAFNGNFDRSAFRVAQFRHQHPDPVSFQQFFKMEFERMRNEQNGLPVKGYFQSVAYSYLENPTSVQSLHPNRDARRAVDNPNDQSMMMLQLVELERMNDFHSAIRFISEYLERWPDAEDAGVYRLRQLEYRRLLGETISDSDYAPYLNGEHGEEASKQAKVLEWFYGSPTRALVGMNSNSKSKLLLDGKPLMSGDHPFYLYVIGAELGDGTHKIAIQSEFQRSDPWVQVGVRMGNNIAGTGTGTLNKREVPSDWITADVSAPDWYPIEIRNVPRGVPDAPYIGGIANAFVLLQSKTYPISGQDWGYYRGATYFRQDFSVPIKGWPSFSRGMTGLQK